MHLQLTPEGPGPQTADRTHTDCALLQTSCSPVSTPIHTEAYATHAHRFKHRRRLKVEQPHHDAVFVAGYVELPRRATTASSQGGP